MADLIVLAEDTSQTAPAKEDSARPMSPPEAVLFAHVRERAADNRVFTCFAGPEETVHTVRVAFPWTYLAIFQ